VKILPESRQLLWQDILQKIQTEWVSLDHTERAWVVENIEQLTDLQRELHALVAAAEGEAVCRDCAGGCCGTGLYHPTLVTVLAHLVLNLSLPCPDFQQSCPYLATDGCQFPPSVRPFNCLIFICDKIETRCSAETQAKLLNLEGKMREIYEAFDGRYAGSSLRGLMNQTHQAQFSGFLSRRAKIS
jgi:hypothetical protein